MIEIGVEHRYGYACVVGHNSPSSCVGKSQYTAIQQNSLAARTVDSALALGTVKLKIAAKCKLANCSRTAIEQDWNLNLVFAASGTFHKQHGTLKVQLNNCVYRNKNTPGFD